MQDIPRWTAAVARGEEAAFNRLYDAYYERLLRYTRALVRGDAERGRDVLQETFLRIVRYLTPKRDEAELWGWMRCLARSAWLDQARRLGRHARCTQPLPYGLQAAAAKPNLEVREDLEKMLGGLPEADRALLVEKYSHGRSTRELSEELGCSAKAVESRLARVRRRARGLLGMEDS